MVAMLHAQWYLRCVDGRWCHVLKGPPPVFHHPMQMHVGYPYILGSVIRKVMSADFIKWNCLLKEGKLYTFTTPHPTPHRKSAIDDMYETLKIFQLVHENSTDTF
jgi:hypothetical protein